MGRARRPDGPLDGPCRAATTPPTSASATRCSRRSGRDLRELQRSLGAGRRRDVGHHPAGRAPVDLARHCSSTTSPPTCVPTPAQRSIDPHDRSVQVHACHGAARQVEVLREVLLGLLADDPTLEPRDILVMCPDIEAYAPLVEAAFGLGDVGDVSTRTAARGTRATACRSGSPTARSPRPTR